MLSFARVELLSLVIGIWLAFSYGSQELDPNKDEFTDDELRARRLYSWLDKLSDVQPIFGVPLNLSQALFILYNIYKSYYISSRIQNNLKYCIAGITFSILFLEVYWLDLPDHFLLGSCWTSLLSLPVFVWLAPNYVSVVILGLTMCISLPLHYCLDLVYLIFAVQDCIECGYGAFQLQTAVYAITCFLFWTLLTIYNGMSFTLSLMFIFAAISVPYVACFGHRDLIGLRAEFARFLFVQIVISCIMIQFYEGGKLTFTYKFFRFLHSVHGL